MINEGELEFHQIVLKYVDSSGTFNNLPKRGDTLDTEWGILEVIKAEPMSRYLDGGTKPFEVHLTCCKKNSLRSESSVENQIEWIKKCIKNGKSYKDMAVLAADIEELDRRINLE